MSSSEYQELKSQMDRIERLLARIAGVAVAEPEPPAAPVPPPPVTPGMTEKERIAAVQAEGRFIDETQGSEAYKRFWQLQCKKAPRRAKIAKAA